MNHADRLALFTLNKLSEIFSTRTKAWERLSNTHADQIIAQHIIFAYFIKVSHVRLHVTVWPCCLQRYLVFLQEKAIKIHVANGAGVGFLSLVLPSEVVWGLQEVLQTLLCFFQCSVSAFYQAPNGFASPCAVLVLQMDPGTLWKWGAQEYMAAGSAGVARALMCHKVMSGIQMRLLYIAWEYPPP